MMSGQGKIRERKLFSDVRIINIAGSFVCETEYDIEPYVGVAGFTPD